MEMIYFVAGGIIVILVVIWASYTVGKNKGKVDAEKIVSEKTASDMAHDAEIASKPFVDSPFSRMRPK